MPTKRLRYLVTFLLMCCVALMTNAQSDTSTTVGNIANLSQKQLDKYTNSINNKTEALTNKLEKVNQKALKNLQAQEQKLRRKLTKVDSSLAKQIFDSPKDKLQQLTSQLDSKKAKLDKLIGGSGSKEYLPLLDTFSTSLKFLENKLGNNAIKDQATKALGSIKGLEDQLQNATDIKAFIKERKAAITEAFDKYGMGNSLQALNKQAYYYGQQVTEYKQLLKDPQKLEERAIAELTKLPLFQDFMQKNSFLASLFRVPDNYGTPQALAGLQTRASLNQLVTQRLGNTSSGTGGSPQQYLQSQVQQGQNQLNTIKDKLNSLGSNGGDVEMPNFKPNTQKTKSFLNRLEYGLNVQSQKTNALLPVATDFAFTVGYKLNDKSTIGIGAGYKLGWGDNLGSINLSNQGFGLRSYLDIKLKGSVWISGGYEKNYLQEFSKLPLWNDNDWQSSGLIGLTKKYKVGKKSNNFQILWDFLSYQQIPKSQPLKFRIGIALK